jgi:uncharacterized metal-binding protein YceD (DUF177 family)
MKPEIAPWKVPVGLGEFTNAAVSRDLNPSEDDRRAIAKRFALVSLDRLEAKLTLVRWHDGGQIDGRWKATVTQNCGVTLEDYATDLSGHFRVRVVPQGSLHAPDPEVVEIAFDPEADDPPDVLEDNIVDLAHYVLEELSLSIDPFPRKPDAVFVAPEPEVELSPFAILRQIKPVEPKS